jgi:phosphoserine phosphatase
MKAKQRYADIYFDCDSTLSTLEGIDTLARGRTDVQALTQAAMDGRVPLEDVYRRRLELVHPSRADVERLGASYCHTLVPDAGPTLAALQAAGKRVHILSGGLALAVRRLAAAVHVPDDRVHAVEVLFDRRGEYEAYQFDSPLARGGGKRDYLRALDAPGKRGPSALIGDGATDLEAADAVDLFIGYGGVVRRADVEQRASVYVSCKSIAPVLVHLLTLEEWQRLDGRVSFRKVLAKAAAAAERGEVRER